MRRLKLFKMVKDKVALITGGTTGIGFKTAEFLASKGAIVYINYHSNNERTNQAYEDLTKKGYKCQLIQGDVSSEKDVNRMVERIIKEQNKIDILINNILSYSFV